MTKVAGAKKAQMMAQNFSFLAIKNFLAIKEDKIAEINQTIKPSKINKNIFINNLKNYYKIGSEKIYFFYKKHFT